MVGTPIYLDYNATTPLAPAVQEAMLPFLAGEFGNPSSRHAKGVTARAAVEDARAQLARLLGVTAEEIFFTSGGTESSNLALRGVWQGGDSSDTPRLMISAIEHVATTAPANWLAAQGIAELDIVGCDDQGRIAVSDLQAMLTPATRLVSIMHANNEVGTVQPIADIAAACRANGSLLHVDAAQTIGKLPVTPAEWGADMLSLAGHKFYGPKGIGALYVRRGVAVDPLVLGAGQESGLRPGTEPVALIAGMGAAAKLAHTHQAEAAARLAALRDDFESRLRAAIPGLVVFACEAERLPNTAAVSFPGVNGAELLARCPGVCASTGAACHTGEAVASATLRAMGVSAKTAAGGVRFSLGWYTEEAELASAAEQVIAAWEAMAV